MLTTYGMVLHNASQLMSGKGSAVARGAWAAFCFITLGARHWLITGLPAAVRGCSDVME